MEHDTLRGTIHLALAQHDWHDYTLAYVEAANRDHYIIVDNGAAENATVSDIELVSAARRFRASEIVVPDIMRDAEATIARCDIFFKGAKYELDFNTFRFMGVVQGRNMAEILRCAKHFAKNQRIRTIGIPRHLITTTTTKCIRIDVALEIAKQFPDRFDFHLLGTDRTYLKELFYVGKYHGWIRSVDTSAPYIYSAAGIALPTNPGKPMPIKLRRPDDYFTRPYNIDLALVKHNVGVLNGWCRGEVYGA
jgi:hypothetical protein